MSEENGEKEEDISAECRLVGRDTGMSRDTCSKEDSGSGDREKEEGEKQGCSKRNLRLPRGSVGAVGAVGCDLAQLSLNTPRRGSVDSYDVDYNRAKEDQWWVLFCKQTMAGVFF